MRHGARQGSNSGLRGWLARVASPALSAMVVPGPELANAFGLDLMTAGLSVAASPRQANVLVILDRLPPAMHNAAAVLWAQMPRPRMLLVVGDAVIAPLPEADVRIASYSQRELEGAVARLRELFAGNAYQLDVKAFEPDGLRSGSEHEPDDGSEHQHGNHEHHGEQGHAEHEHEGHGHDHGGMDFMSMVEMTKDLPRSSDGLAMEWLQEVPFGPCFPGLPGGLMLALTLDGDTVAAACARSAVIGHFRPARLPMPADEFVDWLATVDPLAADAYRLLAVAALENVAAFEPDRSRRRARAWRLERQRAASHLGWLHGFAQTLGLQWLRQQAAALQRPLLQARADSADEVLEPFQRLHRRLNRTPLLARRLSRRGIIDRDAAISGPLSKAAGKADDVRLHDQTFVETGFAPVLRDDGDILARWQVRLQEIEQSLRLMQAFAPDVVSAPDEAMSASGDGRAQIEAPRGTAGLKITVADGQVQAMALTTPSSTHMDLVPALTRQQELGDALLAVASLDLSPWEVLP